VSILRFELSSGHQPAEILESYRDRTEIGGFELKIAGVLKDGKTLRGPAP
jgi:hypothetical protein